MRTTLDIKDEVLERVKEYAAARSISQGAAVSEVLERGFNAEIPTKWENGLLVFDPGPGAETLTLERTLQLEDEMEGDLH
ncbi:MAG TPA: hypothetical protein VMQ56_17175 [Terracidiphilus sp.]|jgi:hypothetical protein|nr:hypothetical protein [Terracidiphilus sp.]